MLIKKGDRAYFVMTDDSEINAPRGSSMLHDPSGRLWGKCALLFVSFKHGGRRATPEEYAGAPREYLGREYEKIAKVGTVEIPPRALSSWECLGRVKQIFYNRIGTKAPGLFQHPFGERSAQMLFRKGSLPTLYRLDKAMRLELHGGCVIDDRGIVWP
jgi:hypothetical protein